MYYAYKKRKILFYGTAAAVSALYTVLLFLQPPAEPSPGFVLSETAKVLLKITIAIPLVLTWFLGADAIFESSTYAKSASNEKLRSLFRTLSISIGILLLGLVVGSLVGQLRSYFPDDESVRRIATIIVNYTYVFPPLLGFFLLSRVAGSRDGDKNQNNIVAAILTIIIGAFWIALIFTNTGRQTSQTAGVHPSFYLSDLGIVLSIIVPTLLAWFFGIKAAFRLSSESWRIKEIPGLSREWAFSRLVSGIWLLIFSYILLFGLLSAGSERLLALGLRGILIAIYVFFIAVVVAHWRIALSIRRLGQEELKE